MEDETETFTGSSADRAPGQLRTVVAVLAAPAPLIALAVAKELSYGAGAGHDDKWLGALIWDVAAVCIGCALAAALVVAVLLVSRIRSTWISIAALFALACCGLSFLVMHFDAGWKGVGGQIVLVTILSLPVSITYAAIARRPLK